MENTVRRMLWTLTMAIFFGAVPWTVKAATPTFTHLYVFGDSYCDVGNIFIATGGADPAPPYYNGRFSNGPIWVDHVAGFLGLTIKPSLAGGTDFAFGGAEVTAPVPVGQQTIPSVPQQVALYLQTVGGKADPNALYILEGGGNDILNAATSSSPQELGFEIALGISESELLLRQAGALHFLIPNLFNVGLLPAAAGKSAFATAATNATNRSLNELLALEGFLEGIHIIRLDVFRLESAVVTDPTHFGFTNITTPCLNTSTVPPTLCNNPYVNFFWDIEHPTEFGHAFFAVAVENTFSTLVW